MKHKNFDWVVVMVRGKNTAQYHYANLFTAVCGLMWLYVTKRGRGTMNFSLVQVYH